MSFDTTRLVSQINIKGALPEGRFTDQELLDLAYDCLLSEIVPLVLEAREDYLVSSKDFTITASQAAYVIPNRALNGILREVKIIDGTNTSNLPRINLNDIKTSTTGTPTHFYTQGNSLYLYPTPDTTQYTLRMYYFIRPSRLVSVAECARITAISTNTLTVTLPTGWTTANVDLVRGKAHFDILDIDLAVSSSSATTIVLTASPPSTLAVGDYVTLAEETCFPFLPPEGHVALVQCAVTSALEALGDSSSATSAAKAEMLKTKFANILKTRVEGEAKSLGTRLL